MRGYTAYTCVWAYAIYLYAHFVSIEIYSCIARFPLDSTAFLLFWILSFYVDFDLMLFKKAPQPNTHRRHRRDSTQQNC